uniref:Tripartite motif containing 44 n=1 Tax=Molossus molossus TaxID=27622 RepID=A0A7J8EVD7_MOLMO|nr:tripartite motif containing 44 [Molossus molossus]
MTTEADLLTEETSQLRRNKLEESEAGRKGSLWQKVHWTGQREVTRDQMKVFIQQEFKKVQKVIADEEQKALHLVDIQEAMATAHVTEILADIQSHMDRLMTQMAQAKEQLDTSNEAAEPKAEVKENAKNYWLQDK